MLLTNDFQTADDYSHLEKGEHCSDLLLDSVEDSTFSFDSDWTLLVEDHAEDVLPLNHRHTLLNHVFANAVENHFEKLLVIVEFYSNNKKR